MQCHNEDCLFYEDAYIENCGLSFLDENFVEECPERKTGCCDNGDEHRRYGEKTMEPIDRYRENRKGGAE